MGLTITGGITLGSGLSVSQPFDPYFEYTTLLLPGNGTNNGNNNTFLDGSTNSFTITRNGNTTQGTFSPYSQTGWSNYFDGTGDYLTLASNAAFAYSTSAFTIEAWVYLTGDYSIARTILGREAGDFNLYITPTNGYLSVWTGSAQASTTAIQRNTWVHVAVVREGTGTNQTKLYVDGTAVHSFTNTTNFSATTNYISLNVGIGSDYWLGYISNLRVVKGTAVYTTNFTPPTSPLTAIANTSLLTCQSNRFIDNSTNNLTITRNGDVSVQSYSPFNPTSSYSTSTVGGSGYFDGSGDWLSFGAQSAFDCGTGTPFCMETWVYPPAAFPNGIHFWSAHQAAVADGFYFTSSGLYVYSGGGGGGGVTSNKNPTVGAWNHCVLTRDSGGRLRYFVNGELTGTSTTNVQVNTDGRAVGINGGINFTGDACYQSQSRYIKGSIPTDYQTSSTTLNTQIFTPPTAPLTTTSQGAVAANVIGLVNYTNGQIIDATSKNTFESVGNTVTSTTQSKWGGSSIYFPGFPANLPASANNAQLYDLGTGDFTIECWVYFSALSTDRYIFERGSGSSTAAGRWALFWRQSGTSIAFQVDGTTVLQDSNGSRITTGQWYHIAVTRASSTARLFVDGTQVASATVSTSLNPVHAGTPSRLNLGNDAHTTSYHFNGYIDDARLTRGIARYTSNFTVPAGPFLTY